MNETIHTQNRIERQSWLTPTFALIGALALGTSLGLASGLTKAGTPGSPASDSTAFVERIAPEAHPGPVLVPDQYEGGWRVATTLRERLQLQRGEFGNPAP